MDNGNHISLYARVLIQLILIFLMCLENVESLEINIFNDRPTDGQKQSLNPACAYGNNGYTLAL